MLRRSGHRHEERWSERCGRSPTVLLKLTAGLLKASKSPVGYGPCSATREGEGTALNAAKFKEDAAQNEPAPATNGIRRDQESTPALDELSPEWVVPYAEAAFTPPVWIKIHQASVQELGDVVQRVVSIESPIHRDEVARRVASLWGLDRTAFPRRLRLPLTGSQETAKSLTGNGSLR